MAYVNTLFNQNFLEYASYVIKDRAIPHIDDGLKPVQRRILHTLFEMDDGKFHKVANVVGYAMRYHPHGDASIYAALVNLANKELFIDKQGNFGNILTGDEASASRYIECRVNGLARTLLYNPELTEYVDSYDGRNREPVVFPAKIPIVLVHGAEGIAVGMSTKVLPHNFTEVLHAMAESLRGKRAQLYPDFPGGGQVDVTDYDDGQGKVRVRATLDTSDPKRIVIRELPFGATTSSLINSIEQAARRGKLKIASISDYTAENVEIEIKLQRGVYANEVIDALYAFTDCEMSISVNLLVIKDNTPHVMRISDLIEYHAGQLVEILRRELELEQRKLNDRLHARTLEQIFVEERIYKEIEEQTSQKAVTKAVRDGFEPFRDQIPRAITDEDIERLLKIPIRRISRYDIEKARKEMREIRERLGEIEEHLKNITAYSIGFLESLEEQYGPDYERRTTISSFEKVDLREAAGRDLTLRYDEKKGYLGYEMTRGSELFAVSPYDRILIVAADGTYRVSSVPEKQFVGTGMLYCGYADKEHLQEVPFSVLYRTENGDTYLKRFRIEQFIIDREYSLVPEGAKLLALTTRSAGSAKLSYAKNRRYKVQEEWFPLGDYREKSVKASGYKLSHKELSSATFVKSSRGGKRSGNGSANGAEKKS
jgi:topoisomerase-4 subunit A